MEVVALSLPVVMDLQDSVIAESDSSPSRFHSEPREKQKVKSKKDKNSSSLVSEEQNIKRVVSSGNDC